MSQLLRFLKNWMLPVGMTAGALIYVIYHFAAFLHPAGGFFCALITRVQPWLLFTMLFLTFCKIKPSELRFHRWHLWLLLIQGLSFAALAALLYILPPFKSSVIVEAAMLCLICPTATAAAVVTGKLGGDMPGLITYTILINLVTAVEVPLLVPLIHPVAGMTFFKAFSMILAKVFPLLIMPCLLAWLIRYTMPRVLQFIVGFKDLAFYIWGISLTLAILMTTRSIFHSRVSIWILLGIAMVSLICCAFQFWAGKRIGARYGKKITAGQSLGQKNTVFAIWKGYTFMSSVTSVAGGMYSIWHNCYNSWQLYKQRTAGQE